MTFLATWGCASDFFKMLPKFKMAATGQLQKILWAQKPEIRNYSNFTITFPTIWRCAGDIFKVVLKFKMATTDQLHFFGSRKNPQKKFVQFFYYFNITFLATCGCAIDFLKMLPITSHF